MRKALVLCLALPGLAACSVPVEPAVSQYNGDSVSIQINNDALMFASDEKKAEVATKADAKAAEICTRGHKKRAELASSRHIPTGQYSSVTERLYLCLN